MEAEQARAPARGAHTSKLASIVLAGGVAAGVFAIVLYGANGYSRVVLLVWLAALASLGAVFASRTAQLPVVARRDLVAAASVGLVLSPLYLIGLHNWPVQVNSDEVANMGVAARYAVWGDPFGLSDYAGAPALLYRIWGTVGELFGGVDLTTMRAVHAVSGLLAVAASYFLFRQLLPRRWTVVVGLSLHVDRTYADVRARGAGSADRRPGRSGALPGLTAVCVLPEPRPLEACRSRSRAPLSPGARPQRHARRQPGRVRGLQAVMRDRPQAPAPAKQSAQ